MDRINEMKDTHLIAQFMGAELLEETECETPHGSCTTVVTQKWKVPSSVPTYDIAIASIGIFFYESDWSWLMPVVAKIESIGDYTIATRKIGDLYYCSIRQDDIDIILRFNESKIKSIYISVVDFIKNYNQL